MPAWGEILGEYQHLLRGRHPAALDLIRRKYLASLHAHTGRAVILYATRWTQPGRNIPPEMLSVNDEDLQALMTVLNGLSETELDLIIHSPGGSIEAAEAFVTYLRSKFTHIRVVVPQQAMSAATMIACSADEIVLGKHSFLGPIDPQFIMNTPLGHRVVTAQNIEDQFERAQSECADPAKMGAWVPILNQYGPDMLQKCEHASKLCESLTSGWMQQYMFRGVPNAKKIAKKIASWLSSHKQFRTHGRHISREELQKKGLKIKFLEADPAFQDLSLSIFHATTITFDNSPTVKIVENHSGKAFMKTFNAPPVIANPPPVFPFVNPPNQPAVPPAGPPAI
jgi:hypothetical protein